MANDKIVKIKKLEWHLLNGHFQRSHIASTPFGTCYCCWVDSEGSVSAIPSKRSELPIKSRHNNLQEAKDFCQVDFEKRVFESIENIK